MENGTASAPTVAPIEGVSESDNPVPVQKLWRGKGQTLKALIRESLDYLTFEHAPCPRISNGLHVVNPPELFLVVPLQSSRMYLTTETPQVDELNISCEG